MHIGQLSRQISALPGSSGGFTGNTLDNPKNQFCKAVETGFEVITNTGEVEIVEEELMEKEEVRTKREKSKNQGAQVERGVTIEQLIDKNSHWRRNKKQILNDPNLKLHDYIKPHYPIIKKKPLQEDEAGLFTKFKEMMTTLQVSILFHEVMERMPKFYKFMKALLKGTKQKLVKEHVNMTEKDETTMPQTFPPKLKDPDKFTISYTIGGVKIPHTLCNLWFSINVMPLNNVKELKLGKTILSNMTLTLIDPYVKHLLGILQDTLVHVDGLVFPAYFMVIDMKEYSGRSIILGRPFLATGKALIDVETSELILKFNKEKVVFNVYGWTPYVDDLETCYQLEEKGSKDDKVKKES